MECPQTEPLDQPGFFERLAASGKRIPLSGSLEVTFRCNLRCVHCYLGDFRNGIAGRKELSKEEICGILDQVADAGTLWFLFTGGEPFIRPDFLEIYRYAAHKGLILTVFTNGTLLTERIVKELADLPPKLIEITLYGATEQTYERITGVKGSYARCMRGIDLILEHGLPLGLKTIMMKDNYEEFDKIKTFITSKGLNFHYDPLLVGALDKSTSTFPQRLSPDEIVAIELANQNIQAELESMLERNKQIRFDNNSLYICGAGNNTFHIDPYGSLSPCLLSRDPQFDLTKGTFQEGWNGDLRQARSQPAMNRNGCKDCDLLILCRQCPGRSTLETGNPYDPVDYFCQIGKLRGKMMRKDNGFHEQGVFHGWET